MRMFTSNNSDKGEIKESAGKGMLRESEPKKEPDH